MGIYIGADVPAESMTLHAVDALFVRMGARDSLATGQSTFALELGEAGAMLRRATAASLVACDELGRGTATHDGAAIAHATLGYLAATAAPRTLFSTHYHRLAAAAGAHPGVVALAHMGCHVSAPAAADNPGSSVHGREEVTFLYKLRPGACPKSYGVNVARLAGLPERVLAAAAARAAALEETCGEGDADAGADADAVVGGGASAALSDAEAAALMAAVAAAARGDGAALAAAAAAARAATAGCSA
jgi:DNA mismatch repair protein MSH6